jgi:hypothetical protein
MEAFVSVLVAGERSEAILALLADRGIEAAAAEAPLGDALAAATVVVLAEEQQMPLPPLAWEVLEAGRLLVAPRAAPAYGLRPGIDHLAGGSDHELADLAALAATFPGALEPVVAMGRLLAQLRNASA